LLYLIRMSTQTRYSGPFQQLDPVGREYFPDAVIDAARLESLAALEATGCHGLVGEVVATFLDTVPRSLDALKDAFLRGDSATVERVAHSLRGSCGLLGAQRMAESAGAVERSAWPAGSEADEGIARLNTEWPKVQAILERVLVHGPNAALAGEGPVH
jgi:HPt (histidine-containing phosphotransfer) domain-containing protein